MSNAYNQNRMGVRARVICERGKFFIETGSAGSFKKFVGTSAGKLSRYIPSMLINRIENLINQGNRAEAILLWEHICVQADNAPSRYILFMAFSISYMVFGLMALYAFLKVF